jgi:hypothetical protein
MAKVLKSFLFILWGMAKIYVKTIFLVVFLVIMVLLRLHLLIYVFPLPDVVSDTFIGTIIVAIIINEKFTRGERWGIGQRFAVVLAFFAILYLRLKLA